MVGVICQSRLVCLNQGDSFWQVYKRIFPESEPFSYQTNDNEDLHLRVQFLFQNIAFLEQRNFRKYPRNPDNSRPLRGSVGRMNI